MTLVTLAGSSFSCSFWAKSTWPVSFSMSSAALAFTGSSTAWAGSDRHSSAESTISSAKNLFFMTRPPHKLLGYPMRPKEKSCRTAIFGCIGRNSLL